MGSRCKPDDEVVLPSSSRVEGVWGPSLQMSVGVGTGAPMVNSTFVVDVKQYASLALVELLCEISSVTAFLLLSAYCSETSGWSYSEFCERMFERMLYLLIRFGDSIVNGALSLKEGLMRPRIDRRPAHSPSVSEC
jgi:hypothetical protein